MKRCLLINLIIIITIPISIYWIDYELHKKNHHLYVFGSRIKIPENSIILEDSQIEPFYSFDISDWIILKINPKDSLNIINQIKNSGYIIKDTYSRESKEAVKTLNIPTYLIKWLSEYNCIYNYFENDQNETICFGYIHELNWLFYYHLRL